jgi:hypothetical protein
VPCPCCNPPYCCPSGDPSSFLYTLSVPSGQNFGEIASKLTGTFVMNPTSEKPSGQSSPYYSIASDDISTFPATAAQYIGMPFDGRVWGYGGLGCSSGVPSFTVVNMITKARANQTDGTFTTVYLASLGSAGPAVTGTDCFTDATTTFGNAQINALILTYRISNNSLVGQTSQSFSPTRSLTMRF